jgi:hypothetical protein
VVTAVLVVATSATAAIVPGRGLAGVELRMTEPQVLATLGAPASTTRSRGALGVLVTRFHYPRLDVDVENLDGTPLVVRAVTTRPNERTASGVGVGSTLAAVERLRGARCWSEAAARYCRIGSASKPLSRVTVFWIEKQRVALVSVALAVNS